METDDTPTPTRPGSVADDASALVVGTVIGTGVFLKAAPMAQAVGAPSGFYLPGLLLVYSRSPVHLPTLN